MIPSRLLVTAFLGPIVAAQQLQCNYANGGCNKGATYDSTVRSAAAKFDTGKLYGGTDETVIFSSTLDSTGTIIAGISYSCTDGSKPPAVYGSVIKQRLDQILTCANRCGSIPVTADGKCGIGILLSDGADAQCFSQAGNANPSGRQQPELPSSGTFNSIGCWTDSMSARTLTGGTSTASDMTVQKCVALAVGYKYAGVEYGVECFWGNEIASTGAHAFGECTMACGGDQAQLCGDGNRLNVYQNTAYQPPPQEVASFGTFVSRGCHSDSMSARALSNSYTNYDTMTVELCLKLAAGSKYAGVEYYGECYWGNELASTSTSIGSGCNTPCNGAPSELCGGGDAINLYEDTAYRTANQVPYVGDYVLRGCYVDSATSRTLQAGGYQDWSGMTVNTCADKASGYRYMGVEYYGECYYGDTLQGALATVSCDTPCAGDQSQICGGGNLITVYEDRSWSDPTREELAQALVSLVYSLDTLSRALAIWHEAAVAASMPSRMMHKRAPPTLLDALRNVQSAASSVRWWHDRETALYRRNRNHGTITEEEEIPLLEMNTRVTQALDAVEAIEGTTAPATQAAVATQQMTALGMLAQHWWEATELFGFIFFLAVALAPALFEQRPTGTETATAQPTQTAAAGLDGSVFDNIILDWTGLELSPGEGIRLLSFDAEDVRCITELFTLKKIMETVRAHGRLAETPKPVEYFDMMGGTGVGGMFAILLGRVGLSVDELLDDLALGLGSEQNAGRLLSVETWQKIFFTDETMSERRTTNSALLMTVVGTILDRYGIDRNEPFRQRDGEIIGVPTFVTAVSEHNLANDIIIGTHEDPETGFYPSMEEIMRITLSHSFYFSPVVTRHSVADTPVQVWSADSKVFNPTLRVFQEGKLRWGRSASLAAIVSLGSGDRRVGLQGPSHEPKAEFDRLWYDFVDEWFNRPFYVGEELTHAFHWAVYHRFSVPSPGFFNVDTAPKATDDIIPEVRQTTDDYLARIYVAARIGWVAQLLLKRPNLVSFGDPMDND